MFVERSLRATVDRAQPHALRAALELHERAEDRVRFRKEARQIGEPVKLRVLSPLLSSWVGF